jgi:hypothetical protein
MKWFGAFWTSATDVFRLRSANRKLNEQLDELDTHTAFDDIRKLNMDNLKDLAASERQRSKDLDEKLSKLTAVLSIALTISGVATKMVSDSISTTSYGTLAIILMFLAMFFLFCGTLIGFSGLRPKPTFGYGGTYLHILQVGGETAEKELKGVVSSFQVANAIRANYGSAAIDLIRNGVIAFALGIALSAWATLAHEPIEGLQTEGIQPVLLQSPADSGQEVPVAAGNSSNMLGPPGPPDIAASPEPEMEQPPTESRE